MCKNTLSLFVCFFHPYLLFLFVFFTNLRYTFKNILLNIYIYISFFFLKLDLKYNCTRVDVVQKNSLCSCLCHGFGHENQMIRGSRKIPRWDTGVDGLPEPNVRQM